MSGFRPWIIALLLWPGAAGSADDSAAAADPVLAAARAALARQDYGRAASVLRGGLSGAPANADYHNLYAFAARKRPSPDLDLAFKHYHEALRLDPGHRGAHEYIGEAYLLVGNVRKAREHLAALDRLCFFGCEEYSSLKKAVRDHEAKAGR